MEDRGGKSPSGLTKWYELFSRGARDWLRHDEKVRDSVRENLPQIVAGADVMNDAAKTVAASRTRLNTMGLAKVSLGECTIVSSTVRRKV